MATISIFESLLPAHAGPAVGAGVSGGHPIFALPICANSPVYLDFSFDVDGERPPSRALRVKDATLEEWCAGHAISCELLAQRAGSNTDRLYPHVVGAVWGYSFGKTLAFFFSGHLTNGRVERSGAQRVFFFWTPNEFPVFPKFFRCPEKNPPRGGFFLDT